MIRGLVEIFNDDGDLIYCENNLIVDGAGEHIANFLSLPTDGSSISAASSIYDASNFRMAAISYGKQENCYLSAGHTKTGISLVGRQNNQLWVEVSSASTSSPQSYNDLPDAPNPQDTKLINFNNSELTSYASAGLNYINSLIGQNTNILNFYHLIPSSIFGFNVSGQPLSAILQVGTYAPSTTSTLQLRYADGSVSGQFVASNAIGAAGSFGVNGSSIRCADYRGFIQPAKASVTNPAAGLVTSGISPVSATGKITYQHTILRSDVKYLNLYGGVTTMGLWVLDLNSMLNRGLNPPYKTQYDDTGLNNLDYKLFSKKVFSDNIVKFSDFGTSAGIVHDYNVVIRWSLYFT